MPIAPHWLLSSSTIGFTARKLNKSFSRSDQHKYVVGLLDLTADCRSGVYIPLTLSFQTQLVSRRERPKLARGHQKIWKKDGSSLVRANEDDPSGAGE